MWLLYVIILIGIGAYLRYEAKGHRHYKWVVPLGVGAIAGLMVYIGNIAELDGFNLREGFWGTHFLDNFHSRVHPSSQSVLGVVSAIWFAYAFLGCFAIQAVIRAFRHPKRHAV
jgi:hypothetical protein